MCGRTPTYGHQSPTFVTRVLVNTLGLMGSRSHGCETPMFIFLFLLFLDHKRLPNIRSNQGIGFVCISPHVIGFIMYIWDVFISMYHGKSNLYNGNIE